MSKTKVLGVAGLLLGAALFLWVGTEARADDDFDGKWTMNANGWTFVLKIKQDGDSFTGVMHGLNHESKSTVEGKIDGNKITFTREGGQKYRGYLFTEDPSDKGVTKQAMAGVANNGDDEKGHFGWYATR